MNPEYLYPRKIFEQRDDPDTKHKGASSKVKQKTRVTRTQTKPAQ